MFQAYKYNLRKKVMYLNKFREVQYKNHPVDCTRPNYTKIQGVFLLVPPSVEILYENTLTFYTLISNLSYPNRYFLSVIL